MTQSLPAVLRQASHYLSADQVEQARQLLIPYIKQNPGSEPGWFLLALCLTDRQQQADCYRRVLMINPHNVEARLRLERLLIPHPPPVISQLPESKIEPAPPQPAKIAEPTTLVSSAPRSAQTPNRPYRKSVPAQQRNYVWPILLIVALLTMVGGSLVIVARWRTIIPALRASGLIAYLDARDPSKPDGPYDIYTMKSDGAERHNLTSSLGGTVHELRWSPDGKKIAFRHNDEKNTYDQIFVMNADGSNIRNITTNFQVRAGRLSQFVWSPQGDRIAFLNTNQRISAITLDGTELSKMDPTENDPYSVEHMLIKWMPNDDAIAYGRAGSGIVDISTSQGKKNISVFDIILDEASWSPDSKYIACTVLSRVNGTSHSELFISKTDGSGAKNLSEIAKLSSLNSVPHWSPDSQKIIFIGPKHNIYIVNLDGSGLTDLTHGSLVAFGAWWMPDGRIAYLANPTGPRRLYIMDADGSHRQRVSFVAPLGSSELQWSPDVSQVIVETDRAYYLMNVATSEFTRLGQAAQWQP